MRWFVADMFAFENVGFTHAHQGANSRAGAGYIARLGKKFLACADCEVGPIGVVEEEPSRYLIAVDRVSIASGC